MANVVSFWAEMGLAGADPGRVAEAGEGVVLSEEGQCSF